jgi:hypothetical protein
VVHPGGGPPPHIHRREEEAFFVLRGELSLWAEGERLPAAHAGDWVALPRDGEHAFKNETAEPVEMLIMVAPAGLEQMFHGHCRRRGATLGRRLPSPAEKSWNGSRQWCRSLASNFARLHLSTNLAHSFRADRPRHMDGFRNRATAHDTKTRTSF